MDIRCEGSLLVPPDRGTIIGRAVWKARYVVLGPKARRPSTLPRTTSAARLAAGRRGGKTPSSRPSVENLAPGPPDKLWLSVYKHKDDWELVAQHPVSSLLSCEIQNVQWRKPGPIVPTLVVAFELDPVADKARKRRSSRTGGLSASSAFPNSLLFRTIPDERYNIYDWQATLQPQIRSQTVLYDEPLSPESPAFTTFINPFAPRSPTYERPIRSPRPEANRGSAYNPYATAPTATRERSQTSTLISPSPSLRSKSSNVSSSQASSFGRPQGYRDMLPIQQIPADMPSPTSMVGFDEQSILGWTSAQGRSSALSSHTRGSNSVSVVGTPPAPRETILDRAFMLRCIPGSDRLAAAEEEGEKLSSTARFEALMREAEERLQRKVVVPPGARRKNSGTSWNLDEEEEEQEEEDSEAESDPDRETPAGRDRAHFAMDEDDIDPLSLSAHEIPTPAQRALEYISGRGTPLAPTHPGPRSPRATLLPPPVPRSMTTPPRVQRKERPKSMAFVSSMKPPEKVEDLGGASATAAKRRSSNSAKRLSLTDFAKRLSSNSSLLLVQTNASSSGSIGGVSSRNSRQSSEASFADDADDGLMLHRGLSQSRLSGMGPMNLRGGAVLGGGGPGGEMDVKRCGWRGSGLGVFGGEGGFV